MPDQFEEENELGHGGGGEVDDEKLEKAWETAEEREGGEPWAKFSTGRDPDEPLDDDKE